MGAMITAADGGRTIGSRRKPRARGGPPGTERLRWVIGVIRGKTAARHDTTLEHPLVIGAGIQNRNRLSLAAQRGCHIPDLVCLNHIGTVLEHWLSDRILLHAYYRGIQQYSAQLASVHFKGHEGDITKLPEYAGLLCRVINTPGNTALYLCHILRLRFDIACR